MVFAPTCLEAEVYASAFMVMGPEQTKSFIQNHKELKVYLISTNYKGEWITYLSNHLEENIQKVKDEF
jgi:thiamine biosynthesis lipoprotein